MQKGNVDQDWQEKVPQDKVHYEDDYLTTVLINNVTHTMALELGAASSACTGAHCNLHSLQGLQEEWLLLD